MRKATISREYTFCAAHRIEGHPKCGRMHGHNYKVTVLLTGPLDNQGMVLDFGLLDEELKPIFKVVDHYTLFSQRNLEAFPELAEMFRQYGWATYLPILNTTAEELAFMFHSMIVKKLQWPEDGIEVFVQETDKNEASYP